MNTFSGSEAETCTIAGAWLKEAGQPGVVLLEGEVGAGKTCFVRGMLDRLGWEGPVTSPTYALMQEYPTSPPLVHLDLYRLEDPEEIWELGVEEWLEQEAWIAVEWADRAGEFWPSASWRIRMTADSGTPDGRWIEFNPPKELQDDTVS